MPSVDPAPGVLNVVLVARNAIRVVVSNVEVSGDKCTDFRSVSQIGGIDTERRLTREIRTVLDVANAIEGNRGIGEQAGTHGVGIADNRALTVPDFVCNRAAGLLIISSQKIRGIGQGRGDRRRGSAGGEDEREDRHEGDRQEREASGQEFPLNGLDERPLGCGRPYDHVNS